MPLDPHPWKDAAVPPTERCGKLELKPTAWKARMWRAFDNTVMPMMRLDAPLRMVDVSDRALHDLLNPFQASLHSLRLYLQRGSETALPFSWSVGRFSVDRKSATVFLHRVLDDPFGAQLGSFLRPDTVSDVTLSIALYEATPDKLIFAIRDYDIGVGAEFRR